MQWSIRSSKRLGHAKDLTDHPAAHNRIERHVEETRRHGHLIEDCIRRLGRKVSGTKTAMAWVMGKTQGAAVPPTRDRAVKIVLADYAMEHFEIACYQALIAAADAAGDSQTVEVCREILSEEEDMARFLEQMLPALVDETLSAVAARGG